MAQSRVRYECTRMRRTARTLSNWRASGFEAFFVCPTVSYGRTLGVVSVNGWLDVAVDRKLSNSARALVEVIADPQGRGKSQPINGRYYICGYEIHWTLIGK